jgi:hypothetical protein
VSAPQSTINSMQKAELRIDARLAELVGELHECQFPMTLEDASRFIRAAFGRGYQDALIDPTPLTEEEPMLKYSNLFLP